jgi:hypothetical protein
VDRNLALDIPGVLDLRWLKQPRFHFLLGHRPVLHAARDNDEIAFVQSHASVPTVSGTDTSFPATSFAIYADLLSCGNSLECPAGSPQALYALNENYDDAGTIRTLQGSVNFYGGSIISGAGVAEAFALIAPPGDTATIDSTTTAFTSTTGPYVPPPPIPEPRLVTLLSIGVLGLVCATRVRLPR